MVTHHGWNQSIVVQLTSDGNILKRALNLYGVSVCGEGDGQQGVSTIRVIGVSWVIRRNRLIGVIGIIWVGYWGYRADLKVSPTGLAQNTT